MLHWFLVFSFPPFQPGNGSVSWCATSQTIDIRFLMSWNITYSQLIVIFIERNSGGWRLTTLVEHLVIFVCVRVNCFLDLRIGNKLLRPFYNCCGCKQFTTPLLLYIGLYIMKSCKIMVPKYFCTPCWGLILHFYLL